jgi:hypothetical protein
MTTAFPDLCPTRRDFVPGQYPTRRFTAINGAGRTRIYGNAAFDATLTLEFLLDDSGLALLLKCWHDARGGYDELELPDEIYIGFSADVQAQFQDYLTWRWAEAPQVTSLAPERTRVRVSLIGTLDD